MPYFDDSANSAERRDPNLVSKLCQPLLEGLRAQIRKYAEFEFHVTQAALLPSSTRMGRSLVVMLANATLVEFAERGLLLAKVTLHIAGSLKECKAKS